MSTSQDALMFEPFYLISCKTAEQYGGGVVSHRWCDGWGGTSRGVPDGGSDGQTDRPTAHQLCRSSVVCAGVGMWPKTTSTSSNGAPSTDIRAADLFELFAIVPWQMDGPDRLLQRTNAHVNTHAANFAKLSDKRQTPRSHVTKLKAENIQSIYVFSQWIDAILSLTRIRRPLKCNGCF